MYSHVTMLGRFVDKPDLRITPSSMSVSNFTVAVDHGFGEKKKTAFVDCVAWGKTAENIAKYMDKGRLVFIAGHLQTRSYEASDGLKRKVTEVVIDDVRFMPSAGNAKSAPADSGAVFDEESQ